MTAQRRATPPKIDSRAFIGEKPHHHAEPNRFIFTALACLQAGETWPGGVQARLCAGEQRDSTWGMLCWSQTRSGLAQGTWDKGPELPARVRGAGRLWARHFN